MITSDSMDGEEVTGTPISTVIVHEDEMAAELEQEEQEVSILKLSRHVKAARAQRLLLQKKQKEARDSHYNGADTDNKIRCLVVDYAQNMELPWFGEEQPGEIYYYTPLNVFLLGVVDVVDDTLHAHLYHEGQAKEILLRLLTSTDQPSFYSTLRLAITVVERLCILDNNNFAI